MQTTILTHLEELQVSAARMKVLFSDNPTLISYFKDLEEKIGYVEKLSKLDARFDWLVLQECMDSLYEKDSELTNFNINIQIKPIEREKKEARLTLKMHYL